MEPPPEKEIINRAVVEQLNIEIAALRERILKAKNNGEPYSVEYLEKVERVLIGWRDEIKGEVHH